MRGAGRFGAWILATAACAALTAGTAAAAERYVDLYLFQTAKDPSLAAIWDFSRAAAGKDQMSGNYLVSINEAGSWNALLSETWTGAGNPADIASRPTLEAAAQKNGALTVATAAGGGLALQLEAPTPPSQAPIMGATKISVQFHRATVDRNGAKLKGWVAHENAVDDLADTKKFERIALWDANGNAFFFTLRDDHVMVAARIDSTGTMKTAVSSMSRWTKTSEASKPSYPTAWMIVVPDWKWQIVLSAEGTPSVTGGRIVQQVVGTAAVPGSMVRFRGIDDLLMP